MSILDLLWRHLRHGSMTIPYPDRPPVRAGFRGVVSLDPSLCIGCAMCRFRCSPRAITFSSSKTDFHWSYDPAQCTFCGRCVDGCKEQALHQESVCPPVYLSIGVLKKSYTMPRKSPAARPRATGALSGDAGSTQTPNGGPQ